MGDHLREWREADWIDTCPLCGEAREHLRSLQAGCHAGVRQGGDVVTWDTDDISSALHCTACHDTGWVLTPAGRTLAAFIAQCQSPATALVDEDDVPL